jgi:hypothetical protein
MRDEQFTRDLYAKCQAELETLDAMINRMLSYNQENFAKNACKSILDYKTRVLLIMERLANGEAPPEGKTAWEHVTKDEP